MTVWKSGVNLYLLSKKTLRLKVTKGICEQNIYNFFLSAFQNMILCHKLWVTKKTHQKDLIHWHKGFTIYHYTVHPTPSPCFYSSFWYFKIKCLLIRWLAVFLLSLCFSCRKGRFACALNHAHKSSGVKCNQSFLVHFFTFPDTLIQIHIILYFS